MIWKYADREWKNLKKSIFFGYDTNSEAYCTSTLIYFHDSTEKQNVTRATQAINPEIWSQEPHSIALLGRL